MLELSGVAAHLEVLRNVRGDAEPLAAQGQLFQLRPGQRHRFVDHLAEIDELEGVVTLPPRQVLHPRDARGGVVDDAAKRSELLRLDVVGRPAPDEREAQPHDVEGVVEIVRNARGDLADGLHPVTLVQRFARAAQFALRMNLAGHIVHEKRDRAWTGELLTAHFEHFRSARPPVASHARNICPLPEENSRLREGELPQVSVGHRARRGASDGDPFPPAIAGRLLFDLSPPVVAKINCVVAHEGERARRSTQRPPTQLKNADLLGRHAFQFADERFVFLAYLLVFHAERIARAMILPRNAPALPHRAHDAVSRWRPCAPSPPAMYARTGTSALDPRVRAPSGAEHMARLHPPTS